jgi:hypothetical protein
MKFSTALEAAESVRGHGGHMFDRALDAWDWLEENRCEQTDVVEVGFRRQDG